MDYALPKLEKKVERGEGAIRFLLFGTVSLGLGFGSNFEHPQS